MQAPDGQEKNQAKDIKVEKTKEPKDEENVVREQTITKIRDVTQEADGQQKVSPQVLTSSTFCNAKPEAWSATKTGKKRRKHRQEGRYSGKRSHQHKN